LPVASELRRASGDGLLVALDEMARGGGRNAGKCGTLRSPNFGEPHDCRLDRSDSQPLSATPTQCAIRHQHRKACGSGPPRRHEWLDA